jgi:hypothetical protein
MKAAAPGRPNRSYRDRAQARWTLIGGASCGAVEMKEHDDGLGQGEEHTQDPSDGTTLAQISQEIRRTRGSILKS